ncbi:MAG: metal-dependent transcriptional regulator [Lachnospiraceae bacterium]|nr:metal-dependent transcriptional regulator [Lachnospiraceae bacterium]
MNESAEDYIKTIYMLQKKTGCVHSVDVAREMGFTKASVSAAMANLRKKDIIRMQPDGEIVFTTAGRKAAEQIYEKHTTLSEFLKDVAAVDDKTAKEDACRIEHYLSPSTFDGIKKFVESRQK